MREIRRTYCISYNYLIIKYYAMSKMYNTYIYQRKTYILDKNRNKIHANKRKRDSKS